MKDVQISLMQMNDIRTAADVLSRAMLNNPLHRAIFQGNSEKQRVEIECMFHEVLIKWPGIVFLAKDKATIVGVMRMKSCVGKAMPDEPAAAHDTKTLSWRKSVWFSEWTRHDPQEQHWHLGPIAVLPSYCGLGIGSQLIQRFCEEVDRCSSKAYLETDLDQNVRFYTKFGFDVVNASDVFGVQNWYMERPQRF